MPYRNRVTPFGDIVAVEARGLLYGNRGILHDEQGRLVRAWQGRRWIACRLEFRGWWRPVMRPRSFTGLFFLDEATALAAGHRPCALCRHADYQRFREAWISSHPVDAARADDMDRVLHAERVEEGGGKRTHPARLADLPDGTMVARGDRAWLLLDGELIAWSASGYTDRVPGSKRATVAVLTPPSIVAVIRAGYQPALHPSALAGSGR